METKPTVSVVSTAYRPQNWMNVYKSLNENKELDVDFIFVGPNAPNYQLPKNFRFIKSNVKPAQCLEIAYRQSKSDFTINVADDVIFKETNPLDKLYAKYLSLDSDKVIVSPRYQMDDDLIDPRYLVLDQADPTSPSMPVGSFMKRSLYESLGGIDKNFMAVMYDLDVALRVYAIGGCVVFADNVTAYEDRIVASAGGSLCVDYASIDKGYLHSIWQKNPDNSYSRLRAVERFSDENILRYSQGPRGRWRGKNLYIVEVLIDSPRFFARVKRGLLKPSMYFNYILRLQKFLKNK